MMEDIPILECTICIDSLEHHTWQGRLLALGEERSFPSERALLALMEDMLEARQGRREKEGIQ